MIYKGTKLSISDNSGAKKVQCIHICNSKQKVAYIGDAVLVSIKNLRSSKRSTVRVKKGEIHKAIIIRAKTSKVKNLINSGSVSFMENSAVLVDKNFKLFGSRIIGPVQKSFRESRYSRFASLASGSI